MRMVSKPISALGCGLLLANTLNINITQDKLASLLANSTPRGAKYRKSCPPFLKPDSVA